MKLLKFVVAAMLAATLAYFPAVAENQKPNVIIILADDLGWTDLGCYGSKFYHTPNLDKLATTGVRFTDGYSAAPVCSPTRAALLTGKSPAKLKMSDWIPGKASAPEERLISAEFRKELATNETTVAEMLKSAGYVTASIGKWHLGRATAKRHGFDVDIAGSSSGSPTSYFSPYKSKKGAMPLSAGPEGEYLTDRLTDEAVGFIERNKEKPFFLYMPHFAVHTPLQAKPSLTEKYAKLSDTNAPHHHAVYAAMIESLDDGVGGVVGKLKELNLTERTVIVFTSDNGGVMTTTSNAPLRAGKGHIYEGGLRVPFIVSWPGRIEPTVSQVPVTTLDLLPTILEWAGVQQPKGLEGNSLIPALKNQPIARKDLFWHYPHYSPQGGKPGGVIRQGDFKLVQWFENGAVELYDLRNDPGEKNNLADSSQDKANELIAALDLWRRTSGAEMMFANPKWTGNK